MSSLEVACGKCNKKFRVRAEFAGRSTRCPGCSSPITIGGPASPALSPPRPREEDRPRPRQRKREEDDEDGRRPSLNWTSTEVALRREQWAIIFVFVSILGSVFVACLGSLARPSGGLDGPMPYVLVIIGVGPVLVAAAFGLMARVSALSVPRESWAKRSAVASLLCGIAGLGCIVAFGFSMLISMESGRPNELPSTMSLGALIFSALAAWATFTGFTVQVGIACKSYEVSRGIGRMATILALSTLGMIGIGVLYTLVSETSGPSFSRGEGGYGGGYYYEDHSLFYSIMLGVLVPLDACLLLIFYHRLLAAARRSIVGAPAPHYND